MLPLTPVVDPDEARARVHEELAKAEYDDSPGFVSWFLSLIEEWMLDLLDGVSRSSATQATLLVLLVLLLGVIVVLVLRRTGLIRRSHGLTVSDALDAEPVLSGSALREAARRAILEKRTDDGTVLALRALVRDLEERALLDVAAGMTAQESAARAARAFPELGGRLTRAAEAFDTAAYSHRSTSAKQAEDLLLLAEYIAESAPDLSALETAVGAPAPGSTS